MIYIQIRIISFIGAKQLIAFVFLLSFKMLEFLKNYLLQLNIFGSTAADDESRAEQQRRSNIIATRVYIVVLTLVLIILALGLWLGLETVVIILYHPTKDQFEILPSDARCPCTRISIAYGELVSIRPRFHQICSSDFSSDRWIKAIYSGSYSPYFLPTDFRSSGSAQFQALSGFCRLSQSNIQQANASFSISALISPKVLSETVFRTQFHAIIEEFKVTVPNAFNTQLQTVLGMVRSNKLMSGLQTNTLLKYFIDGNNTCYIYPGTRNYDPVEWYCDCQSNLDCSLPSTVYDTFGVSIWPETVSRPSTSRAIPGIKAGCMPVNMILLSTLECFYNQTCVDQLISFFPTTEKFTAMAALETSRFQSTSTVQSIVNLLMVEEWSTNISYEKYYARCAPISCTFSKVERHTVTFVIIKLIGLLGGLTIILGLVIPAVTSQIMQRLHPSKPTPSIPRKFSVEGDWRWGWFGTRISVWQCRNGCLIQALCLARIINYLLFSFNFGSIIVVTLDTQFYFIYSWVFCCALSPRKNGIHW